MNKTKEHTLTRRRMATRVKTGEMLMRSPYRRWIDALVISGVVLFLAGLGRADTYNWNGSAGSDWFAAANWTPPGPPPAGADVVYVNAGASLLLTNETPLLATFTQQSGTLTCTNWFTRIRAANVTLEAGTITLPPAFTETGMSNRVWIVASGNFMLGSNAVIDVNGKGYLQANGEGEGLRATRGTGAGHGGQGGMCSDGKESGGLIYGCVEAPTAPGSGGGYGGGTSPDAGPGGGSIRIEVGGSAVIHGTVSAKGGASTWRRGGGGSGGSIFVTCSTFSGSSSGLLTVDGGACLGDEGGSGGGGRIAVDYTVLGSTQGVRFSAAPGKQGYAAGNPIHWHRVASMGTLWLPDTGLLSPDLSNGPFNQVRLVIGAGDITWSVPQLAITNAVVAFAGSNVQVNVAGNLLIGAGGSLHIGDRHGAFGGHLACGGSLTVSDGGALWIFSGATNGFVPYGASFTAAGDVMIGAGSWIYPAAHPVNGGGARLRMRNLMIAEQGGIDADARGFGGTLYSAGPGKGGGSARGSGGGYGGKGGRSSDSNTGGVSNGVYRLPLLAGSSGGHGTSYFPGKGGGLVWIEASGAVTLDGSITADGGVGGAAREGGGAGGGIFLVCAGRLVGGPNSVVAALGGNGGPNEGGGGGGGRIAIYPRMSAERLNKLLSDGEAAGVEAGSHAAIETLSVEQGWGWADYTASANPLDYARAGTIVVVEGPPPGAVLMVR